MYCDVCTRPRCGKNTTRLSFVLLLVLLSFPPLFESFLHSFFALDSLSRACLGKRSFTSNVHYDDNNDDFNDRNGNVIMYIIMSLCILSCYYVMYTIVLLCYSMYRQLEPRSPRHCRAICCGAEKQHPFWRHYVVHLNDPVAKTG